MAGAADRDTELRANDLYWRSGSSVNQIADQMNLSKGVLYGLIRPRRAGLACPECGEEVVYPNRTAKERRQVACPNCGWAGEDVVAGHAGGEGGVVLPHYGSHDEDDVAVPPFRLSTRRERTILGGVLLGAAVGLALVLWAKRRR